MAAKGAGLLAMDAMVGIDTLLPLFPPKGTSFAGIWKATPGILALGWVDKGMEGRELKPVKVELSPKPERLDATGGN